MILEQTGELAPSDKPWQLIRDAIHDLELQEKTEGIKIDMCRWHMLELDEPGRPCRQCLAGAVMSRRLRVDTKATVDPGDLGEYTNRLLSLDAFRGGYIQSAYLELGLARPESVPKFIETPTYAVDKEGFKRAMLALADKLEQAHKQEKLKNDLKANREAGSQG